MEDIIIGRDDEDKKRFGTDGTVILGKHYVKMGQTSSLANNVRLDMVRPHVVMLCGKRGGGKCLAGDTMVSMHDGSQVPIRDLCNNDKDIIALNKDLRLAKSIKSDFYKRKANTLLEVKLRTGKSIKLTPEHPLLTISGWKKAEDIPVGGRIATPRHMSFFGENAIPEHEIKILGYLIAEGHLGNNKVLFSNEDPEIVNDFINAVNEFDSSLTVKPHGKNCYTVVQKKHKTKVISVKRNSNGQFTAGGRVGKSHKLKLYLDSLGIYNTSSHTKHIPEKILTSTRSNILLLLNRLFSCDGTIYYDIDRKSWRTSYCSVSNKLISQVQELLLRIGIFSIIRKKSTYCGSAFELEIQSASVPTFLQEIGFFGKKIARQNKALKETENISRNPSLDTTPREIWEHYKPENWAEMGRHLGYKHPKALRESTRYSPPRQKLCQIALCDHRQDIINIALSDIYWDEIINVRKLEGEFEVYDITVPENHNFVANGIIVHNSYTIGVIAEGMAGMPSELKKNVSVILLDTMGVFWTMKYENHKEADLLKPYGLETQGFDVQIYTPYKFYEKYKEKGIPTDFPFAIKTSELDAIDWCLALGIDINDSLGVLLEKTVMTLKESGKNYSLKDMIKTIKSDDESDKNSKSALVNRLLATEAWGLFDEKGTPVAELAQPGKVTVLDVSCYATMENGWNIKSLVVGLVGTKMFIERMLHRKNEEYEQINATRHLFGSKDGLSKKQQEMPLVWLVIDEAHEFLPREGKTAASNALITILREGRQPGISLVLATQQPGKIHTDVMTQADTVIAHRITAKVDTEALGMLMQSYMRAGLDVELDNLPRVKGAALIFDDTNEKLYQIRIRPRMSWHGGESPTALKEEKKLF